MAQPGHVSESISERRTYPIRSLMHAIDESGNRHGRWTVIRRAGTRSTDALWLCLCDCGEQKEVRGTYLRSGVSKSCGCLRRELAAEKMRGQSYRRTHGHTRGGFSPTYMSWVAMNNRCRNPLNVKYPIYGGRGIAVCKRWESFENFLADMGERPEARTLDRIDVNGNYEPGNCRWATASEQRRNQRQT